MLEVRVWISLRTSIRLRKFMPLVISHVLFYVRLLTLMTGLVCLSLHVNLFKKAGGYLLTMASIFRSMTAVVDEMSIGNAEGEKFVRIRGCNYDSL
jgi:hypothetical protein